MSAHSAYRLIAQNKVAYHNYFIEEEIEAGIVLVGSEVKSIRAGKVSMNDTHAENIGSEIFLFNLHIAEYKEANRFNHDTRRPRKLLLHANQIRKLIGKIRVKGYTLVALSLYFNEKNIIKVKIGLARGKKKFDKREDIKDKDWKREQGRLMREK
jgi:SsrA-binding protein